MRLSLGSEKQPQPRDTRGPARNPSRPFHVGWSAMPLMDSAPSIPVSAGLARVIATAIEVLARAVVPAPRCHSCESRNRSAPLWIPAFAGMTASRDDGAVLLALSKRWGAQVLVRRLDCEREARERPMDGRRSDFRGHGWSSE